MPTIAAQHPSRLGLRASTQRLTPAFSVATWLLVAVTARCFHTTSVEPGCSGCTRSAAARDRQPLGAPCVSAERTAGTEPMRTGPAASPAESADRVGSADLGGGAG